MYSDGRLMCGAFPQRTSELILEIRREVRDQLNVDGQVGRQYEEVVDAVGLMQITDEGTHEPRLAHAGRERETPRAELAREVRDRRELPADDVDVDLRHRWFLLW